MPDNENTTPETENQDPPAATEPVTVTTTKRRTPEPEGQTAAGSGVLGGDGTEDFEQPVTRLDALGTASNTRVGKDEKDAEPATPKFISQLTKALGLKSSDLLGFNERTRVAVYSNGGKYQVSKNGKSVRHLSGPKPPADLKLNVIDARVASPFVGTAAAINASVHDLGEVPEADKRAELEALRARVAELEEDLGEEEE